MRNKHDKTQSTEKQLGAIKCKKVQPKVSAAHNTSV